MLTEEARHQVKQELMTMDNEKLAELYIAIKGEMYDRKITDEMAHIMVDDEELIRKCEKLMEKGAAVEYQGFLVSFHDESHPNYYLVRVVDSGLHVGIIVAGKVDTPTQLATEVLERVTEHIEEGFAEEPE